MDQMHFDSHISRRFNQELEDIRSSAMEIGGLVEQQLADALRALATGDSELAEEVVRNDYKINAMEVEIDEQCTQILARRQPAASDLRLVVSVIKTVTDLERMGDEAQRIGRMAVHLAGRSRPAGDYNQIQHLGQHVQKMLHDALDAFARTDVEAAFEVVREDRKVDREYESIMRELITFMMEDPRSIPWALDVMWSARAIERIGDRATNIGEYVIYFVKGRDIRHTDPESVVEEVAGLVREDGEE